MGVQGTADKALKHFEGAAEKRDRPVVGRFILGTFLFVDGGNGTFKPIPG